MILPIVISAGFALAAGAQTASYPPSARESIEWCDIWISHANETNLPRVLNDTSFNTGELAQIETILKA